MHPLGSFCTRTISSLSLSLSPNSLQFETPVDVWPSSACELGVTHQGAEPTVQNKKKEETLLIGPFCGASLEAASSQSFKLSCLISSSHLCLELACVCVCVFSGGTGDTVH